jgi:NADPH:quinone reductase-like Zn-dependent oxidoreductase
MKALVLDAKARTGVVKEVPSPAPAPNEVLVQVKAIALNPVDALYTAHPIGNTGRVLGSDFAGVVVTVGSSVPSSTGLRVDSRVAGFLQGACSVNARPGAFAENLVCPWDLVWRIHDLPFEDAATISLCAVTAAQALFLRMGLPAPFSWPQQPIQRQDDKGPVSVFINGASTSVGLYAAQLAQLSPIPVTLFGSASQKHNTLLKGAPYNFSHLVNYRSKDWSQQVLELNDNRGLDIGFDCISEGFTVLHTARTLAKGAKMAVVRSREGQAWNTSAEELGLEPSYGAVWEGLGEDVAYAGMNLPANAVARGFTVAFYAWLSEGRKIVPNPVRLIPGGLEKVAVHGFALLGSGSMDDRKAEARGEEWMRPVSGEKLVCHIK